MELQQSSLKGTLVPYLGPSATSSTKDRERLKRKSAPIHASDEATLVITHLRDSRAKINTSNACKQVN